MSAQKKLGRFGMTAQAVAIVSVLLLIMNLLLGFVLVDQSRTVIKSMIKDRMLDVANTAAAVVDGDAFGSIEAEDRGTPEYEGVYRALCAYRDNIDLQYIYGIRQVGERDFIFTIDPSFGTPGEFGEAIVYTDALYEASKGVPSADDVPYEDAWGRHYSAYSPVYDSSGVMAGLVGVDFSADWYDEQIETQTRTAVLVGVLSLCAGALVVLVIMSRLRRRFRVLYGELSDLAADVESLTREVVASGPGVPDPGFASAPAQPLLQATGSEDDIDALGSKIRSMQEELRRNIEHVREQAYTDVMTGIGNKNAYMDAVDVLREQIAAGQAAFSIAVLDINGLKQANDEHGHDQGDVLIAETARVIVDTFGKGNVYRVGGDEFIAVLDDVDEAHLHELMERFDAALARANERPERAELPLAVSKGGATFEGGDEFRAVFRRADEAMYEDKAAYYEEHGDRRGRYLM